ncbi:hypothetical protein D3C86_1978610 [compost metagenome]
MNLVALFAVKLLARFGEIKNLAMAASKGLVDMVYRQILEFPRATALRLRQTVQPIPLLIELR